MRDDSKTNIQVSRTTRNRLAELGKKDDSYDDIIIRLLNFYESKREDILWQDKSK